MDEPRTDYSSNSRKQKDKELSARASNVDKKVDPVITSGEAVIKKKSIGYRLRTTFFGGDLRTATAFVAADVLLPALRDLVWNMITRGGESVIYGDRYGRSRSGGYGARTQYNYSNPVTRGDGRTGRAPLPDQPRLQRRIGRDTRDVLLPSRDEAELVLERLNDIIDKYEIASVADLCSLLDVPSGHVDNKFGWGYLKNVEIRQMRDGMWLLDLPPEQEID